MRTHVDLFSGIGGFALAARWAGVETIAFAEIDPYASGVLERRFPGITNYGDVRNVPGISAWLVTGGVPCQPASIAGQRRGAADDRWLWPEALAVVERIRPTWLCLENPLGILSMEQPVVSFDLEGYGNLIEEAIRCEGDLWAALNGEVEFIFRDLTTSIEKLGYTVAPLVIPACGLGTWHRRYRVWIMGHANSNERRASTKRGHVPHGNDIGREKAASRSSASSKNGEQRTMAHTVSEQLRTGGHGEAVRASRTVEGGEEERERVRNDVGQRGEVDGYAASKGLPDWAGGPMGQPRPLTEFERSNGQDGTNADGTRLEGVERPTKAKPNSHEPENRIPIPELRQREVERDFRGVAHGVSARVDRLRSLGNAIVPQVAYQLIKRMIEAEEQP